MAHKFTEIDRVGILKINNNGLLMCLTEYIDAIKTKIQFEDGIYVNRPYTAFEHKHCKHPNTKFDKLIVQTREKSKNNKIEYKHSLQISKCGQLYIIVKYNDSSNVVIQFAITGNLKTTSAQKIHNKSIQDFNTKYTFRKKDKTGFIHKQKSGYLAVVTTYTGSHDINIMFEDGIALKNKSISYTTLKNGYVGYPGKQHGFKNHLGEILKDIYGKPVKIIKYTKYIDPVTVQFENGITKTYHNYGYLTKHILKPPDTIGDIHLDEFAFIYDGEYYYICSSPKWNNDRKILSVPQIYDIINSEEVKGNEPS